MAFALKGTGSATTTFSVVADQSSLVFGTVTTTGSVGDLAVLLYAVDNNQTTDGDEGAVTSVTDTQGNQWQKAVEFTNGQGTAQTGATCGIWYCNVKKAMSVGTFITINFNNITSRDASAASLTYFTKAAGFDATIAGTPGTLANDAAAAGSLNVTTANIACLRVRAIASESSTATVLTATASFAVVTQAVGNAATSTNNQAIRGEWIINTGTGTASAPTGGAGAVDNASVYVAFSEFLVIAPQGWSEPVRIKSGLHPSLQQAFQSPVIQPTLADTRWLAPLSEPSRPKIPRDDRYLGENDWTAVVATIEWFAPLSEPVRVRSSPAKQQVLAFAPNPIVATGWSAPLSMPTRAKQRAIADYAYAPLAISEVVTIDKWFNPLAPPLSAKPGLRTSSQPSYFAPLVTDNSIALNNWFSPLIEPVRVNPPRTSSQQALAFVEAAPFQETVTESRWHQPWSEPVRQRRALTSANQTAFFAPSAIVAGEVIAVAKWFSSFADVIRPKTLTGDRYLGENSWTAVATTMEWFAPLAEPVRQKLGLSAANQQTLAFVTRVVEVAPPESWFAPLADPVRIKRQLATSSQQSLALVQAAPFAETVTESRWHQPWSEPVRVKRSGKATVSAFVASVTPEIVTSDKWFAPLTEPVRQKVGLPTAQQQALAFVPTVVVVVTTDIRWFEPLSEPVRTKVSLPTASQQALAFVKAAPFPETVTESRWHQPWSEPVRQPPRLATASQAAFFAPSRVIAGEAITVDKWFSHLSYPVWRKPEDKDRYSGENDWTAVAVTIEWFAPLTEPVRQRPRLASANQLAFFAPSAIIAGEVVTVDKWLYQLSEPVRIKPALRAAIQQSLAFVETTLFAETVTESRWHQPWSEPLRSKPGLSATNQAAFFAPSRVITAEIVTVDKWYRPFEDPVRAKHPADDRYLGENNWTIVAASMEWFAPLNEPVRQKIGLSVTQQQTLTFVTVERITVDKWFASFTDPVRVKPALLTGRQQFLTWPTQIIIPSLSSWWRPLAEPPKAKAGLLTANQRFETRTADFIPHPNQFLEGWYNWLSEPVRKLAQLNVAMQRAWFGPDRNAVQSTVTATMAVTEVNGDVALFAIKVLPYNAPATAVVSLVEIGHGASLTSIVEIGDDGSGTSVVEN